MLQGKDTIIFDAYEHDGHDIEGLRLATAWGMWFDEALECLRLAEWRDIWLEYPEWADDGGYTVYIWEKQKDFDFSKYLK